MNAETVVGIGGYMDAYGDGREARDSVRLVELLVGPNTGLKPGEGPVEPATHNPDADATIDEALDRYASSLRGWEGKVAQLAAEAAYVPWVLSPEEYMEEKAFEAAERVIAGKYLPNDPATRIDADAYRETMRWFRIVLDVMKSDPAFQPMGGDRREAEPDLASESDIESDVGRGIDVE